jgi:biotin carboxylase
VLKPRSQAAALGIRKLHSADELWQAIETLGDSHADYLIEQFVPGDVYHVDSIVVNSTVQFAIASRYRTPPMAVAHEGGIFVTQTLPKGDPAVDTLHQLNAQVLGAFGLVRGASHTEFIRAQDGRWNFLETSARVGGAFIVDVAEAASGLNLWREWAKVEIAGEEGSYEAHPQRDRCAGIVLSLARQEMPDTSAYTDPEIATRIRKPFHAGLIVASSNADRVTELLDDYTRRFYTDFHASAPPPDRPLE